jgi:hypothetical protein
MTQENGIVPARQQAALVSTYLRQLGFKHRASRSDGFQVISKPLSNTQYIRMGDAMSQLDAYTMQLRVLLCMQFLYSSNTSIVEDLIAGCSQGSSTKDGAYDLNWDESMLSAP